MGHDALSASRKAHAFGRTCLDIDRFNVDGHIGGDVFSHRRKVGRELWRLSDNGDIRIGDQLVIGGLACASAPITN